METTREHVLNSGYASSFERLIDYVDALLPTREVIHNGIREDAVAFPAVTLREFIANMLIHQDLTVTGAGPMVEVFADRIEISNPGESLVAAERMIDAPPRSRNETTAALMRRFGISSANSAVVSRLLGDALKSGVIVVENAAAGPRSRAYLPFWAAPAENGIGQFI